MVQPNEEANLEEKVKWDPGNEEGGAGLYDGGSTENNPVCEPLLIIGGASRVDGLERHIRGVNEGDEIGHELGTTNEKNEAANEEAKGKEKERLGLSGLVFKFP